MSENRSDHVSIRPVTGTLGAEVEGIDLREPLDDAVLDSVLGALWEHSVLLFRDQEINDDQQLQFTRQLGSIQATLLQWSSGALPLFSIHGGHLWGHRPGERRSRC